jgi:hypothetical protein
MPVVTQNAEKRMDSYFSVFNGHVNNADKRANAEFIAQFGQEAYDNEIKPLREKGIMLIFETDPTRLTMAWVALVTAFVNENRE